MLSNNALTYKGLKAMNKSSAVLYKTPLFKQAQAVTNSQLFKQAHAMTRATIQDGDDYRVTFGACLKAIKQDNAKQADKKLIKQAIATALPFTGFFALACLLVALFIGGISGINAMNERNEASFAKLYDNDTSQTVTADDSLDIMFNDIQKAIDDSGVEGITIVYNK